MNKNLQSPTKLTEFAPLQPEEKQSGVGQFFTKIFNLYRTPTSNNNNNENTSSDGPLLIENDSNSSQESLPSWAIDNSSDHFGSSNDLVNNSVYSVDVNEGRSLPNVLKRISNLLALKSNNLQDYADTELKQYWMPDSVSKECYECCEKFTTFRRRHHCRVCGQIFCSQCCNQQIRGKFFGCTGDLRVCTYCCKVVFSYLKSSDVGADLTADLKLLQESLQNKFGLASASSTVSLHENNCQNFINENIEIGNTLRRKISVAYQEEKFASERVNISYLSNEEKSKALQNSVSLRNLFEEICRPTSGISLRTHRYRLRTYNNCFLGSELVDWLIYQQKSSTRIQASAICQALLEGGYIESVSEPCSFVDGYALYKLGVVLSPTEVTTRFDLSLQDEPIWVQQISQECFTTDSDSDQIPVNLTSSSSYTLNLNVEANTVYLSRPSTSYSLDSQDINENDYCNNQDTALIRTSEQREAVPEAGWYHALNLRDDNGEKIAYNLLNEVYEQHEQNLLKQLLLLNGLSLSWSEVIMPLCHEVINIIRPDKGHDAEELDIRHYIKFKKLAGGSRNDSKLIGGIVFSKNVAHKGMITDIENPKILLLQCSIVYQRTEGRLMSLEPVLMQETENLKHVAARIVALNPNIVLVQRNVSRLAQDLLLKHGITLVHNVKQTILEQLALCTKADLVTAVDTHIGNPRLGTCKRFHLKRFNIDKSRIKTLMFFEGLAMPHLGSTIILRGGCKNELVLVENVTSFILFALYNWRLEKSFLMDEFAQPPNLKCEFLDDSKENSPILTINNKINDIIIKNTFINNNINESKNITMEIVNDFTDPLHSYKDDLIIIENKEKLSVAELPFSNNFRKSLDDTVLCISPYLIFPIPYLETEFGKKCLLRNFFPDEIYYSEQFNTKIKSIKTFKENDDEINDDIISEPSHPFITIEITSSNNIQIQNLLANFRACGGRYKKKQLLSIPKNLKNSNENWKKEFNCDIINQDCLNINNHQRIAVLFCCFSKESNNAPAFCVNPWVVYMKFYGQNDIPLGCFLEKYCFRGSYTCPSKTCDTPMIKHIRRFVHNLGCVSVILNNFDNEFADDNIVMWSWCTKCQSVSPVVPMSVDTWSFSFAKYLELKFYGGIYSRRGNMPCGHSLHHDHYQYFGYKNYVASFNYSSINVWEISLPPSIICVEYDINQLQNELIDDIKNTTQKGHEVFSIINEKLSNLTDFDGLNNLKQLLNKEQLQFKQKVEEVQLKLTSPITETKTFHEADQYISYWKISDALIKMKKLICENIDNWNQKLNECLRKTDKKKERSHSELDSPTTTTTTTTIESTFDSDPCSSTTNENFIIKNKNIEQNDENEPTTPKLQIRCSQLDNTFHSDEPTPNNKKDSDKKTVKNLLSQLLPSSNPNSLLMSPFNPQHHYLLPPGISIPIVVYENEPSSIIAYALNSYDYKRALDDIIKKNINEQSSPSPIIKRKNTNDKEKNDENVGLLAFLRKGDVTPVTNNSIQDLSQLPESNDDLKKLKYQNIEVQFQDANCNFYCRCYCAEKFALLRESVLAIGEEAYIRSLCRSIQWNARGGKSGSNFSKTADDRFILKEITNSEVQLFLELALNYFNYMQKCTSSGQPTLLGKIVGIYQIIFKTNSNATLRKNLLVMENLFYKKRVTQKFDLKGSMRNRLVIPDEQKGEIVLLDENLMKMTCDSPLYVLPHSKAVLTAAIQNDTEFLSAQSVVDYSLLVGLDSEHKELVLGIIDYIRIFTWDKRLETMVKRTGILGGQGKLPTIVSPDDYQKRFIEAMHRYFLEVPDHWAGLGKGLEF